MDAPPSLEQRIASIAVWDQPIRRDLYRLLAGGGWWTKDQAAAALEVPRSVAGFHLDKLADADAVDVRFERLSGRRGPGAGRPTKLYGLAAGEVAASIPERRYDVAATVLAGAVAESLRSGLAVRDCLRETARRVGRAMGEIARDAVANARRVTHRRAALIEALRPHGYEPELLRDEIVLANCPFHRLAEQERELVCGINLELVEGLLDGAGASNASVRLDPQDGYCCVRVTTS